MLEAGHSNVAWEAKSAALRHRAHRVRALLRRVCALLPHPDADGVRARGSC